jgi:hypothetical protein
MVVRSLACTLALAAALAVPAGSAAAYQCEQQVERALQENGVQAEDVSSVKVVRRSGGARPPSNYTLDAWVRLNSCSNGAVVVHMTKYCLVQDVYTTGACRVGNLPNY